MFVLSVFKSFIFLPHMRLDCRTPSSTVERTIRCGEASGSNPEESIICIVGDSLPPLIEPCPYPYLFFISFLTISISQLFTVAPHAFMVFFILVALVDAIMNVFFAMIMCGMDFTIPVREVAKIGGIYR